MSSLRSILLHIDASPRSVQRLALAHALAARCGAQGTALYASTPTALSLPFVMGMLGGATRTVLRSMTLPVLMAH